MSTLAFLKAISTKLCPAFQQILRSLVKDLHYISHFRATAKELKPDSFACHVSIHFLKAKDYGRCILFSVFQNPD